MHSGEQPRPTVLARRRTPVAIALGYALLASLWIVGSDALVGLLPPHAWQAASTAKGWTFVALTSLLLYSTLHALTGIEKRQRAEAARVGEALRASEARLRLFSERASDVLYRMRLLPAPALEFISPSVERILGWTADELREPSGWFACVVEADREVARVGPGVEQTVLVRWRRRDGSVRWIEDHRSIERDGEGRAVVVEGIVRDVTERREAEERLREEHEKYRQLFDHSLDAVFVSQPDGTVLEANPAACRLLGRSVAEIQAESRAGLVLQDRALAAALAERSQTGHARAELRMRRKDGSTFPVEVESVVVPGPAPRAFVIARDISERRRATDELRRLAAAVEQAPASVVVTDPAGRIEYVNPAFERTSGWSRAEVLGQKPSLLKSGRQEDAYYAQLWQTITAGQVWSGRLINKARDGRLFTEDAVIAPVVGEGGTIDHFVAVKRDVTEELRLQQSLAQSQRLDSVGRLAGGVAHDFNNLLTVILGVTEVALQDLADGRPVLADDLREIQGAGRRASDLTRQLLAFARRQPAAPVPLDLGQIAVNMERLLRRVIGEHIRLSVSVAPDLWTALCDPAQVEQVILNLAVNARDAMPGGGSLRVTLSNLPADQVRTGDDPDARQGDWISLSVEDTGHGIPPEVLPRIFEPFFTTKEAGRGTGLGLSTVYGVVRQAGGHIKVETAPGEGTRFDVRFPRWSGGPSDAFAEEPVEGTQRGSERILVVEDDVAVRELTVRVLRERGYQVQASSRAEDALQLLDGHPYPPALLVTDVVLSGLDGRELARRVQERFPGLPTLFVSGYSEPVGPAGAAWPGGELLSKPFTPSQLLAKVRARLDRPARRTPLGTPALGVPAPGLPDRRE